MSEGINNISYSEQAALNQALSDQTNSAIERLNIRNRTNEEMLADIANAGDVARMVLHFMRNTSQELSQLLSGVEGIDNRFNALLKGVLYLISMRWVIGRAMKGESISTDGVNRVF